jgi:Xaa-Pro aminopeptidase
MHQEQRQGAHEILKSRGVSRALFADPNIVTWLTGFAPPIQLGPHLFAGGPPLVWYEDGHFTLLVVDAFAADTAEFDQQTNCTTVTHQGYTFEQPLEGTEHLIDLFRQRLATSGQALGKIGLEKRKVPTILSAVLEDALPDGTEIVPIDDLLVPLRRVKTDEEVKKLRENFALADIGQAAARQAVQMGKREIDVWTTVHGAIQQAAGCRVPLGNDCLVGSRQVNFTGWPLEHEIKPKDSIIVDLGTGLHGYWSDGCGTYYATEPTKQQVAMHETVADALELAISLIRPGVVAGEIDRQVRQLIADSGYPDYPHHTGHGVGTSSHEAPRIVPYSEEVLEEGMVIMLEPGIYLPGQTAVRLEDGLLVTEDGAEVLTRHDKGLP